MMKGEDGLSLPTLIFVGVIFLLLTLGFLILFFAKNVDPYEQIAVFNFKKLGAAIDEACISGNVIETDFYIPQNIPVASAASSYGPTYKMRNDGDPLFVVYYEMFPPGEAIPWEIYHDFGYRAIATLPVGFGVDDISGYIQGIENEIIYQYRDKEEPPSDVPILISNIVLPVEFDPTNGAETDESIGKWVDKEYFEFSEHWTLTAENKTFLKYIACGENSLCMKTKKGVYVYPLKHCPNLEYIEMDSIAENIAPLYLASPCKNTGKLQIEFTQCDCKKAVSPIYDYVNEELVLDGSHTYCLDRLGEDDELNAAEESVNCVRVTFIEEGNKEHKDGFCFLWYPSKTAHISALWSGDPVGELVDYSRYLGTQPLFVLQPPEAPPGLDIGEWLLAKIDLSNEWRWPLEKGGLG